MTSQMSLMTSASQECDTDHVTPFSDVTVFLDYDRMQLKMEVIAYELEVKGWVIRFNLTCSKLPPKCYFISKCGSPTGFDQPG